MPNVNYFVVHSANPSIGPTTKIHTVPDETTALSLLQDFPNAAVYGTDGLTYVAKADDSGLDPVQPPTEPYVKDQLDSVLTSMRQSVPLDGVDEPGTPPVHHTREEALEQIPDPNPKSNLHAYYNAFPKGDSYNSGSWWHMYWCH